MTPSQQNRQLRPVPGQSTKGIGQPDTPPHSRWLTDRKPPQSRVTLNGKVRNQYLMAVVVQDKGVGPGIHEGPFKNRTGHEVYLHLRSQGTPQAVGQA